MNVRGILIFEVKLRIRQAHPKNTMFDCRRHTVTNEEVGRDMIALTIRVL